MAVRWSICALWWAQWKELRPEWWRRNGVAGGARRRGWRGGALGEGLRVSGGVCVCGFFKLGGGQKLVEDGLGRPAGREGALEERR